MKKLLIDYFFLILGSTCLSLAVVIFFAHNKIAIGGPPGIALIVNYISGLSIGSVLLITNLPLLLLGYKTFGKTFIFRTVIIIFLTSILTDLMFNMLPEFNVTKDRLLNALFGGVLVGSGIGFMFKSGGSSGGWSILAKIIASKAHIPLGQIVFLLDFLVIICFIIVFKNLETALYGIIGIFVSGKIIDLVLIGNKNIQSVHISCSCASKLIPLINEELCSRGTIIECTQFNNNIKKDLIFLSVSKEKILTLKEIIIKHDSESYMIVHNAVEVYGIESKY